MNPRSLLINLVLLTGIAQSLLADEQSTQSSSAFLVHGYLASTLELDFNILWPMFNESQLADVNELAGTGESAVDLANPVIKRYAFASQLWIGDSGFACEYVQGPRAEELPLGSLLDHWQFVDADIAGKTQDFAWAGHPGGTIRVCPTNDGTWNMDNPDALFVIGATNAVSLWVKLVDDPAEAIRRLYESSNELQLLQIRDPLTSDYWNGFRSEDASANNQVTLLTQVHDGVTHVRYITSSRLAAKSVLISMSVVAISPEPFRLPSRPAAIVSAYAPHAEFTRTIFVNTTDEQSWPEGIGIGVVGPLNSTQMSVRQIIISILIVLIVVGVWTVLARRNKSHIQERGAS